MLSQTPKRLKTGRKSHAGGLQDFRNKIVEALEKESSTPSPPSLPPHKPFGVSVNESLDKLRPLEQELAKAQFQTVLAEFLKNQEYGLPPPTFVLNFANYANYSPGYNQSYGQNNSASSNHQQPSYHNNP